MMDLSHYGVVVCRIRLGYLQDLLTTLAAIENGDSGAGLRENAWY